MASSVHAFEVLDLVMPALRALAGACGRPALGDAGLAPTHVHGRLRLGAQARAGAARGYCLFQAWGFLGISNAETRAR